MRQPPRFWRSDPSRPGVAARALAPLGWAYAAGGALRQRWTRPLRAGVPVICVGNATLGGAGKTPVAIALAARLRARGLCVHILSRGYKGAHKGPPLRVDPAWHSAGTVGDEPLLLARAAPTWVGRDRVASAKAAEAAGAEVLVLDDGFQNPALVKDLTLLVVDGEAGFGNGRVVPAGPLREPAARALARADAVVRIGPDTAGITSRLGAGGCPVLTATLDTDAEGAALAGERVLAFAGIGRPAKFHATLTAHGAEVVAFEAFADHHPYTAAEVSRLHARAAAEGLRLVTTEKDAVRLPPEMRAAVRVLPVRIAWDDPDGLDALLDRVWLDRVWPDGVRLGD